MATYAVVRKRSFERQKNRMKELNKKINKILIFDRDIPLNARFTFVDFASNYRWRIEENNIGIEIKSYCEVVERANLWLKENIEWCVVGCETVNSWMRITTDLLLKRRTKWDDCDFLWPLTLFRLWLRKRDEFEFEDDDESIIQQIKYIDFIPEKLSDSDDHFEDLDAVMNKVNEKLKNKEIGGKIINIQTHLCMAKDNWEVNPEENYPNRISGKYVFIIRVFYEIGPPCDDEIGFMDFIPECVKKGHLFCAPKFESQSDTFKRCSLWLTENSELNFYNAQTIEIKIKSLTNVDSKCMSFTKYNGGFLRIIRIMYTYHKDRPKETPDDSQPSEDFSLTPIYLASKTIFLDRSDHKDDDKFLNLSNISISKSIIAKYFSRTEWCCNNAFKFRFLNIETFNIFAENDSEFENRIDSSYRHCRVHESRTYDTSKMSFYIGIVYFDVGYDGKNEIDMFRAFQLRRGSSRF